MPSKIEKRILLNMNIDEIIEKLGGIALL
jgi:hypothetical protein